MVQRPLLYLGEINDLQELAWRKSIAILEEGAPQPRTLSLFPENCCEGLLPSGASDEPSDSTIELMAAVDFKRRGVETKLVLPGLAQQNHGSRCNNNPTLVKAIARGRA